MEVKIMEGKNLQFYVDYLRDTRPVSVAKLGLAIRRALSKSLVCKNKDMAIGVEFALEEIANALKLEGNDRRALFALITAPKGEL
jgi:hypothetical protein